MSNTVKARWIGEELKCYDALTQPGDIGIGAENYHRDLMVQCPVCDTLHVVTITQDAGRDPWAWDARNLTLSPSFKAEGYRGICHWNLTNGEFIIHGDSTAKPDERPYGESRFGSDDIDLPMKPTPPIGKPSRF